MSQTLRRQFFFGFRPSIAWGWGNGYVCIPPGHPAYGQDYDLVDIDIHGGLTFGAMANTLDWPEIPIECKDCYVVGFDTHHYGDGAHQDKEWVENETRRLAEQLAAMRAIS